MSEASPGDECVVFTTVLHEEEGDEEAAAEALSSEGGAGAVRALRVADESLELGDACIMTSAGVVDVENWVQKVAERKKKPKTHTHTRTQTYTHTTKHTEENEQEHKDEVTPLGAAKRADGEQAPKPPTQSQVRNRAKQRNDAANGSRMHKVCTHNDRHRDTPHHTHIATR